MEEQAQIYADWHKRFVDAVLNDKAVIDIAATGDKDNTITAVRAVIDRICLDIVNEISDSTAITNKMEMFTELENYFADKKPNLENYIYDTVVNSESRKEQLSENVQTTEKIISGTPSEQDGVFNVNETLSQVGTRLAEAISTLSVKLDEVDSILRDGGNDDKSVLRIAAHFSKGLSQDENTAFLRREYLMGRWGRNEEPGGKGYQFGTKQLAIWFDENGITIGRGKSTYNATDRADITWEQAAERVKALYDAGQYVSHDVLDEALYNESAERASDIIEVYQNISRGLSDIQYELKKAMTKEQKAAVEDDWKQRRYLISGLTELSNTVDAALNGENDITPDEIMELYNETIRLSEEIPQEWLFSELHPAVAERVTELLHDKGKVSENERSQGIGYNELSEFALIVNRLREDIAALADEPDAPIRFWRNPHRLLSNLEKAGLPAHGFPIAEYQSVNFMRFITDGEIDRYLSRGGTYSEGKLRVLSHFLNDHTPQERIKFLKDEYGHGGGTWIDGWSNAEPGKGINLKRPGCEDINLNWNQVVRRTEEIIKSGRYASRTDLDKIHDYERIMLARQINNFYYELPPDEYERPFPKELDFHYPREDEWTVLNDFLDDTEQIDGVLAQMQYIFVNTPEEDRYYNLRSAGFHSLTTFREGTYTLFPGIEKLPDPNLIKVRPSSDLQEQRTNLIPFNPSSVASNQLSLFDFDVEPPPKLPSAEEQRAKIEQQNKPTPTAEANAPAVSLPITQDEIDALLLTISDKEKTQLAAQFADNPRSKEAVRLVREIYDGIEETLPRMNGESGYLWIMGDNTGVNIVGALPFRNPKDVSEPAETLTLPWATVIKRIGELAVDGRLVVVKEQQEPTSFADYQKLKTDNPGCVVFYQVGETIEFYEDDAVIASQMFDVPLIQRNAGTQEHFNAAVIAIDRVGEAVDDVYNAGYGLVLSSIKTDGSRDVMAIPKEQAEQALEMTADVDVAEDIYYTPKNNIAYRIGDIVEAHNVPAEPSVKMTIDNIDEDYVYYNFVENPNENSVEMFRARFEDYLDNGSFKKSEAQRATYSHEFSAWLERNTPLVEHFAV